MSREPPSLLLETGRYTQTRPPRAHVSNPGSTDQPVIACVFIVEMCMYFISFLPSESLVSLDCNLDIVEMSIWRNSRGTTSVFIAFLLNVPVTETGFNMIVCIKHESEGGITD